MLMKFLTQDLFVLRNTKNYISNTENEHNVLDSKIVNCF